jgi:hypothetical protein
VLVAPSGSGNFSVSIETRGFVVLGETVTAVVLEGA